MRKYSFSAGFLFFFILMCSTFSVSAQKAVVTGSDYPGVNGNYTMTSSSGSSTTYQNDADASFYFTSYDYGGFFDWQFYVSNFPGSLYYGSSSDSDPSNVYWFGGYDNDQGIQYSMPIITVVTPTVVTYSAESVSYFSASLGGEVTNAGASAVTSRGIKWGVSAGNLSNTVQIGSGLGSFNQSITGLDQNTTYYFKAYAINSAGISYGSLQSFNTLLALPVVTTASPTAITYVGATLGGEVTSEGASSVFTTGIKWGVSANNLNNTIQIGSGSGAFNQVFAGISAGTTCYFRAFAENSSGTGYGDILSFVTLHDNFDVLVVSGGGSGGAGYGGGGGGGAVKYFIAQTVSGSTEVTVGAGGAYVNVTTNNTPVIGNPGESSSFGALTATSSATANGTNARGGGGGGGGSGGGAGGSDARTSGGGGTAVSGMGNNGGSTINIAQRFSNVTGGGGGGAGAVGGNGFSATAGSGGAGIANSISGTSVYYGGGGGGGVTFNGDAVGAGGIGGGGAGSKSDVNATNGTANTGGGGGGFGSVNGAASSNHSGAGGSGIVIVRYLGTTIRATGGTITQVGGYTIHTFYSSGTFSLLSCTNPTSGGTIAAAQSGNSPFNPAAFSSSAAASGETGTLEYKWQSSITSSSSGFSDIASSNSAIYDAGALTQTTWFKRLARVDCKADWTGAAESNVLEVTVNSTKTWIGGSGNWSTASNWSDGVAPVSSDVLAITSGTPQLDVDFTVAGSLTISGTGSLTIQLGKRLTISGTADFGGKSLTLKSDATGTATIGQITGTLSNATNVTVERYIPATGRRYRLISPSVNSTGSMKSNWMEGALNTSVSSNSNPNGGYGVQITGTGGNTNGFDVTTSNSASVYATINGTTLSYTPISNTNASLNALTGYFVFVRGDRSQNMTLPNTNVAPNPVPLPSSATTLRATGTLLQGTQTSFTNALNSTTGAMNLVTNPYASAIDWSAVYAASSGISDAYTLWEPSIGYRGGFVTVTAAGVKSNGSSNASTTIQPGQAFFVTATGSGTASVSIQESHKTTTGMSSAVFGAASPLATTAQLGLSLYFNEASGYRRLADGVKALYNSNYQSTLDGNDAFEIPNWDENLAISRAGKNLAIESRPNIVGADTLPLLTSNLKTMNYELQVDAGNFNNPLLKASVVDKFTGAKTQVSLSSTTTIPFAVTTDPASAATNRFSVIFSTAAALPLNFLSFQGKVAGNYTQLNWVVTGEERLASYEVEKSIDGEHFSLLGRTAPKANNQPNNSYQWNDAVLQSGNSFYRIRSVSLDGTINYSKTVKITLGSKQAQVQLYPNPVKTGKANLQLEQLSAGGYRLEWYNSQGQLLKASALQHPGGFFMHNVDVPAMQGLVNWKLMKGEASWKGTVVVSEK